MNKQDFYAAATSLGIGNTPLIPYEEDFDADIYVKNEAMNASGSVKDRPALAMILQAEEDGILHPGDTIVEATSGNMGIALAYIGAKRGYRVLLTMPETMTVERRQLLQGLGAQLVLTEGALGMKGAIEQAQLLGMEKGHLLIRQFENATNVKAHYLSTADEIAEKLDRVDIFVAGVGTGGTLIGTGKRLKEIFPNVKVVAVEPAGSPAISQGHGGKHAIQGIGAGFVTKLYDGSVVDQVQTVSDEEALDMFYMLNLKQGYCCGISSAANIVAATRYANDPMYKGANIVTLFPDGDDRYVTMLKNAPKQ